MKQKDDVSKLELDVLIEEYKSLKTEIVSNLNAARQITNMTLAGISIFIAATPVIFQANAILLFLIVPLFFFALSWTQLRYIYLVLDIGAYIQVIIIPRVRQILIDYTPDNEFNYSHIMSWELPGKNPVKQRPNKLLRALFLPIAGANYGIPLLAAAMSVSAFLFFVVQNAQSVSQLELLFVTLNGIALLYSAFWGFQAEFRR